MKTPKRSAFALFALALLAACGRAAPDFQPAALAEIPPGELEWIMP
jgi:predicted small lipoprotein YifL